MSPFPQSVTNSSVSPAMFPSSPGVIQVVIVQLGVLQWPCWAVCNPPPGSEPSHRAGLEPGMPAREAGTLPRRLMATASSISR